MELTEKGKFKLSQAFIPIDEQNKVDIKRL